MVFKYFNVYTVNLVSNIELIDNCILGLCVQQFVPQLRNIRPFYCKNLTVNQHGGLSSQTGKSLGHFN